MELEIVQVHVITVLTDFVILQDQVTIKILAPIKGIEGDAAVRTVEQLQSIISCTGPDLRENVIRPLHLTLREFLVDEKRCVDKEFYIDRRVHHLQAPRPCLKITNEELCRDMC